jgi:uncharacterized protein YcnI
MWMAASHLEARFNDLRILVPTDLPGHTLGFRQERPISGWKIDTQQLQKLHQGYQSDGNNLAMETSKWRYEN